MSCFSASIRYIFGIFEILHCFLSLPSLHSDVDSPHSVLLLYSLPSSYETCCTHYLLLYLFFFSASSFSPCLFRNFNHALSHLPLRGYS
ncbi:hypothetical protein K503DRAFT_441055 [Rhizopogon vinicolor AM-OR11-026]|uniref:Uncharacterized protein n=1 Tax=Rhizopogon vinicolor AM-OR11-026 TaxID=1314800 RepID=A0A1B7MPC1_9AGAM|nr:hypothetical protein K503DRAFT_441055 [Rhizopogon vinicolor AM-OR11-026]